VAIIEKGKLIYSGPVQGVREQMGQAKVIWAKVATAPDEAVELLKSHPDVSDAEVHDAEIKVTLISEETDHSIVAEVLVRGGARLLELREEEIGLEEVFMRVTRGETQ
jgi:ABC-2 type transport system ATP-binding protein